MKKVLILLGSLDKKIFFNKFIDLRNVRFHFSRKKIKFQEVKNFDLIVCYGYRSLLTEDVYNSIKCVNLHMSYLPYNRGAHPNFWSFVENTPSGVTIHRINGKIDKGNIISQKLVDFELNKNKKKLTFANTYKVLNEIMNEVFNSNFISILNNDFEEFKQIGRGTYHNSDDLPSILKSWDQNIFKTVNQYQLEKEKKINEKLNILDQIENTRKNNNVNWMNVLRHAIKHSSKNILKTLNSISKDDEKIFKLFKKLNEK